MILMMRPLACALVLCIALTLLPCAGARADFARNLSEDDYALRGIGWDMSAEEVASFDGGAIEDGNVRVEAPELYKVPGLRLTYLYEDGSMVRRSFRMPKDKKVYGSMFFSLFMRYGAPLYTEEQGDTCWWELEDIKIELCMTKYVYVIYHRIEDSQ